MELEETIDAREILGLQNDVEKIEEKETKNVIQRPTEKKGVLKRRKNLLKLCGPGIPSLPAGIMGPFNKKTRMEGRARTWTMDEFDHPARNDGLKLKHWVRCDQANEPYLPAKFNIHLPYVMEFNESLYKKYVAEKDKANRSEWSVRETEYLMTLANNFGLRWPVIHDRYSFASTGLISVAPYRTLEDLKARFYFVSGLLVEGVYNEKLYYLREKLMSATSPEIQKKIEQHIAECKDILATHPYTTIVYKPELEVQRKAWLTRLFTMNSAQRKNSKKFKHLLEQRRRKKHNASRDRSGSTNPLPGIISGATKSSTDLVVPNRPTVMPLEAGVFSVRSKIPIHCELLQSPAQNVILSNLTWSFLEGIGQTTIPNTCTPLVAETFNLLRTEIATMFCLQRVITSRKNIIGTKLQSDRSATKMGAGGASATAATGNSSASKAGNASVSPSSIPSGSPPVAAASPSPGTLQSAGSPFVGQSGGATSGQQTLPSGSASTGAAGGAQRNAPPIGSGNMTISPLGGSGSSSSGPIGASGMNVGSNVGGGGGSGGGMGGSFKQSSGGPRSGTSNFEHLAQIAAEGIQMRMLGSSGNATGVSGVNQPGRLQSGSSVTGGHGNMPYRPVNASFGNSGSGGFNSVMRNPIGMSGQPPVQSPTGSGMPAMSPASSGVIQNASGSGSGNALPMGVLGRAPVKRSFDAVNEGLSKRHRG